MIMATIFSALLLSYLLYSYIRFRLSEVHYPMSIMIGNCLFLFFYVLGGLFHNLNSLFSERFTLSGISFYYSADALTYMTTSIFGYAAAFEILNALARGAVGGLRHFPDLRSADRSRSYAFHTILFLAVFVSGILVYRIQSTMGFLPFLEDNVLRAVVFDGLGIVVELQFVMLFCCVVFLVMDYPSKFLLWFSLFLFGTFLTFARWPLLLLLFVAAAASFIRYGFRLFRLQNVLIASALIAASLAFVLVARPIGDVWHGPLNFVFGTEQAPQAANLIVAAQSVAVQTQLAENGYAFLLEFIPASLAAVIGLPSMPGGNLAYTATLWPNRIITTGSEVSLGGLNDLVLSTGWITLLLTFIILAGAYRLLARVSARSFVWFPIEAALCWFWFQLLRSDMSHTVSRILPLVLAVLVVVLLSRRPGTRTPSIRPALGTSSRR